MQKIGTEIKVSGTIHKIEITAGSITYHLGGSVMVTVPIGAKNGM